MHEIHDRSPLTDFCTGIHTRAHKEQHLTQLKTKYETQLHELESLKVSQRESVEKSQQMQSKVARLEGENHALKEQCGEYSFLHALLSLSLSLSLSLPLSFFANNRMKLAKLTDLQVTAAQESKYVMKFPSTLSY